MMNSRRGVLVVGAGQAAIQLASSLRDLGYEHPIRLVGDERYPPYQRPPLSKGVLQGTASLDSLSLRSDDFFLERRIDLTLGARVVDVQPDSQGGVAHTNTGEAFCFDRLVLATGARPRRLSIPGADLPGVHHLHTLDDALHLGGAIESSKRVVVVGGGFIGLEAAASAQLLGADVVLLELAAAIMGRVVGPLTAQHVRESHARRSIDIRTSVSIARLVERAGRAAGAQLGTGEVIEADLVIVGIGATPQVDLAERIGLACDNGIVVDQHSVTSDRSTLAIGDCARLPDPNPRAARSALIRLESVANAVEQSISAASTIMGQPEAYRTVPWFWSNQGPLKLQIAGSWTDSTSAVVRGDPEREKFSVLYYRDEDLVAIESVNNPAEFTVARRALGAGATVPRAQASDTTSSLKSLITGPTSGSTPRPHLKEPL